MNTFNSVGLPLLFLTQSESGKLYASWSTIPIYPSLPDV